MEEREKQSQPNPDQRGKTPRRVHNRQGGGNLPVPGPGRAKGSKNKSSERIRQAFYDAIGLAAMAKGYKDESEWFQKEVAESNPDSYSRIIATILPKQVQAEVEMNFADAMKQLDELDDSGQDFPTTD